MLCSVKGKCPKRAIALTVRGEIQHRHARAAKLAEMKEKCSCSSMEHNTGWKKTCRRPSDIWTGHRTVCYSAYPVLLLDQLLILSPGMVVLQQSIPVCYRSKKVSLSTVLFSTHRRSFPGKWQFSGTHSMVFKWHGRAVSRTCTGITNHLIPQWKKLKCYNKHLKGGQISWWWWIHNQDTKKLRTLTSSSAKLFLYIVLWSDNSKGSFPAT